MAGMLNLIVAVSLVEAGFFSFLGKMLGSSSADGFENVEFSLNSQTMPLLEAALNSNPVSGLGGGGITILNNSALLPDVGPLGSIADINQITPPADRISIYVVRGGDNLSQIAEMFGVSVNTIIWANDIKRGNLIKSGQTLVILPITGTRYIVQKGDTMTSVAKKFKGDEQEIIEFNNLPEGGFLAVGDEIIIPDGQDGSYQPYVPSAPTPSLKGTGGPSYSGYYLRPIEGGARSQGLHGYNAVDLATYCGAPIFASATGDVIISRNYGWNSGYGNYVVITHTNGTQTLYAHLRENIVSAGWHVVKGQVIGYIGTTGKSTGCHVHFEIRGAKNPF